MVDLRRPFLDSQACQACFRTEGHVSARIRPIHLLPPDLLTKFPASFQNLALEGPPTHLVASIGSDATKPNLIYARNS